MMHAVLLNPGHNNNYFIIFDTNALSHWGAYFVTFNYSASDSLATNGAIQICVVLYCIVPVS